MSSDEHIKMAMLSLAERAHEELSVWDARLQALFTELERLDPAVAIRALEVFGDRGLAAAMLFGPMNSLDGKSVMQVALNLERGPLDFITDHSQLASEQASHHTHSL